MEQQYPLTKQQEGLWVEWRLHPDNTSYNTCVKLRLTGDLDLPRFEGALSDVVRFFSSLRVYFTEKNGLPSQHVRQEGEFILEYEDVSVDGQGEDPQQRKAAEDFLARKLRTPVDLKTFPIVRAGLIKTARDVHYFIGIVPHMISDGASAILFLEATSIAYNKGYEGLVEAYGEQPKDWADYFEEASQREAPEFWHEASEYWNKRMENAQHVIDFSYGQADSGNANKTGKRVYFDLTSELSQKLKEYSRSQRTTHFSTLVAAFSLLLNRYYRQDDVLIGYPVNIRPPGYKHLFGFFVNIIPIRVDLSGDPTYEELVARVSASRKADKKYQTFPAMDLVREIRKSQPGFDGRVFNASMAQTVSRLVNLRLDGIQSDPLEAEYNDVNDDLSLSYELLEDGRIGLWLEYRQSMFAPEQVDQMINHMQGLLAQVITNPEKKISEYTLLDDAHRQKLQIWNAPDCDSVVPSAATIHGLIENCVSQNPDKTALVYQGEETTYAQMNARANQLARHIQGQGITVGDKIALCFKRGPQMIYGLLAAMKAGCAYVPIPPCYPAERLAFILKDADCKIVVTQEALLEDFENIDGPALICVDTIQSELENLESNNLDALTDGGSPSYIIYTSGSTGNPKGVLLHHENVVPRLMWLQDEIPLDDSDVVLQNTDYSFDVSVAEIFWPLTTGARLVLTEAKHYKDPSYLIDLMNGQGVTTTCFVPSLLNSLLAVMGEKKLTTLKRVLAAGEALPPALVRGYHEKCSGDLYNVYGPTEAAIYAAFTLCERDPDCVPIGRPLADTTLYILDDNAQPMPMGCAGELHIGGPGVAQGYMNLPEMTADRFIMDSFAGQDGARLYKTGDLCRFLSDGNIEYLGRMDAQVKIRGFRIELAEIETVIAGFTGVEDIAVIDFGKPGEHKRLVAYYVSAAEIDADDLRKHILSKLPEYMVPAFFVRIESVPRVASGKINRRALPSPESLIKKRAKYVAARNETEEKLVALWSGILKIPTEKIGVHDSFFEMGGDSLMAIQFACSAEEKGVFFDTSALFEYNTIAQLAEVASETPLDKAQIDQGAIEGAYPLLPRQAKFFAEKFEKPNHWNRFFFFEVDHDVNLDILQKSFDAVLMHHDNLRVRFLQDENGTWVQECCADLPETPYVFAHDLSGLDEAQQEAQIVALSNAQHEAIDLALAPVIRVLHFKTSERGGKMAVIMHHLLVDIVSSRLIFEDFLRTYEASRGGFDFALPSKTASVKDWANHLQQQGKAQDFSEELAYWGHDDMRPSPSLPVIAEGTGHERSVQQEKLILDSLETSALLRDIPKATGAGIQEILMTAISEAMHAWTGEKNLTVNVCGHGRTGTKDHDLSRSVGWVNTVYPMSLKAPQLENALQNIRDIDAQIKTVPVDNGAYNLLRYSMKHPEITKTPSAEVFFNYISQIDALLPEGLSFNPAHEPDGICSSAPENHMGYVLYIEAGIYEQQLAVHITYSDEVLETVQVQELANLLKARISAIVEENQDNVKISA